MRRLPPVLLLAVSVALLLAACGPRPDTATGPADTAPAPVPALMAHAAADTFAHDALRELCDEVGPRLAGSEGMRRAQQWALRRLAEAGCDTTWTEPVTAPLWERGAEWARLVHPYEAPLNMIGLGRSEGTGGQPLEAEVMAVRDWDEFEARADEAAGRMVLFDPPWKGYGPNVDYRVNGPARAAGHGAVAVLIRPAGFGRNTAHTGVTRYAEDGPRIPGVSLSVEDAALLHRLADGGQRPRVRLSMEARNLGEGPCANVVGEWRGREKPEEIVLISGHLDAWDTGGGAHDDGAGCTMMIAAVKAMHDLGLRPRRTVRVVLYTSEEYGGHGGRAYAERHADAIDRHVLALESDSGCFAPMGFSVRGDSTVIAGLQPYAAPLAPVGADSVFAGWAGVDIGPLVELGVPGVGHRVHNQQYFRFHHSPADVYDAIEPDDLAANVAAIAGFVFGIADSPGPLPRSQPADAK